MKKYTLLSCALSVLLSGCGALSKNDPQRSRDQEAVPELAKHVISVDRDGKLKIIENGEVKKVVPCVVNKDEANGECADYFNGIIKEIEDFHKKQVDEKTEVLLFVHGGLSNNKDALDRARSVIKHVEDEGSPVYAIFVTWESGAWSTYSDHLLRIRQGDESNTARITSPVYFLTDVGNSIVNTPKSWLVSGLHMLKATTDRGIEDKLREEVGKFSNVYYTGGKNTKKEFFDFKRRMQWFLTIPSKVVTTPFVYTMAKPAWDIMLRRTNTLFYTPEDLSNNAPVKVPPPVHINQRSPGHAALYDFLDRFDCSIEPRNDKKCPCPPNLALSDIKVSLVGHSMGAIVVNKILQLKPHLPYKNIVHLASADSISNLFDKVIPNLHHNKEINFYSLSLHPDIENRELSAGGLTPSGSLLTWIDSMYTTPETVFDRRSGRWDNIKRVIRFIPEPVRERMHFKIFSINESEACKDDVVTEPQCHGAFDALAFWREATWWGKPTDSLSN